ncbi:MAG TPA: hypothetical protein VL337_05540 [Acidimicrobiales bacterium]|nr:hypothetical protein [Acidimicrobiales bacterium]
MTDVSTRTTAAGFDRARKVADAVLYEGYVLYPYRASAAKNQIRWQFGVVAPKDFCDHDPGERSFMQTEVLVEGSRPVVDLKLRFLRVQSRTVENASGTPVGSLDVDGKLWSSFDEAVEEELDVEAVGLGERIVPFGLAAHEEVEPLGDAGRIVRRLVALAGQLRLTAERVEGPYPLVKFRVVVENRTPWSPADGATRDDVVRRSLAAVHTLMAAHHGRFVSMIDPPEFATGAVASCQNVGTWPVLIGDEGDREVVLSSPITLYDYPEVAPESEGDMFDSTEIDEILALRILTLTDEEKREARGTDDRAAAIIDRVDAMPPELFDRLHGAIRYLRGTGAEPMPMQLPDPTSPDEPLPWWDPGMDASVDPFTDTVMVGASEVGKGTRVRLRPLGRADAHDMFLVGKLATVEGVFFDVDGETQLAVTLDDDPGADLARTHGRYLYFRPDELEVLP